MEFELFWHYSVRFGNILISKNNTADCCRKCPGRKHHHQQNKNARGESKEGRKAKQKMITEQLRVSSLIC